MKQRLFAELGLFIAPSLVLALVSYLHPISLSDAAALVGIHPAATSSVPVAPMKTTTVENPIHSQHVRPTHHPEKKLESVPVEAAKQTALPQTLFEFEFKAARKSFSLPIFCLSTGIFSFLGVLALPHIWERKRSASWILGLIFWGLFWSAALFYWARRGGVWAVLGVGILLPPVGMLMYIVAVGISFFVGMFAFAALVMFVLSSVGSSSDRIQHNGRWYRAE